MKRQRVLMVCMGNICRSPTAEAVLRQKLEAAGLADWVEVDSAGTHGYHVGDPPDRRAIQHARRRGYDLASLRARRVAEADFEDFDLILAMDRDNLELLESDCPPALRHKLHRLTEFASKHSNPIVPDPYSGGADGFETVLDLVEDACDGLIRHLRAAAPQQNPGTS